MSEIIRWRPFLAKYVSYDGMSVNVTFRCPNCGSENCDRKVKHLKGQKVDDRHFWQGAFRCSDCGAEYDKDGEPFYYASDCFLKSKNEDVIQLKLFEL